MKDTFNDLLHGIKPKPVESDEDLGAYVVCPKTCLAIDIERGAEPVITFQFHFIGPMSVYTPERFTFFFGEKEERWQVTVAGRNLRDCFNRVSDHCVRKLRQATRDMAADGETIITKIDV